MLTLLTATGCRPEAWKQCQRLMAAQDYTGPIRWVIVDDGEVAQPVMFDRNGWMLEIVRPEPFWQHGQNTQARNLSAGAAVIPTDANVVFVEDDDYYAPGFLSAMDSWFREAELVGEAQARYYHVVRRVWRHCGNDAHASLCSTGARGAALALFRRLVQGTAKFIDMELWRQFSGPKRLYSSRYVVGLKGLPGRAGIGVGHRMEGFPDPDGEVLAEWLGLAHAATYERFRSDDV